ncbi:MAG: glycosyltransferase [Acidobacteria bacterium]|nr:glycosyltransferase [Acidobacteriota bacterium]
MLRAGIAPGARTASKPAVAWMTGDFLVSVVVPTYNYGRYIVETLENLRAQTYENWECIVVDDGSTDDTEQVVRRFAEREPRVSYVRQENQRQSVAKNNGLARIRGQYVQFLDADDLIEPRKFERQIEFLESHPETDIVYGGMRYFVTGRERELLYSMVGEDRPWMPDISGAGRELVRQLLVDNIMVINSPLVRREVVDEVGEFDPVLPPVEDWDYWIRCALAGKTFEFRDMEGTRALVRSHPASSSKQRPSSIAAYRRLREKLGALLRDMDDLRRLNREMAAQFEAGLGLVETAHGNRLAGARQFLRAGSLSAGLSGKARWLACALASLVLSGRQVGKLAAFSPSHVPSGLRRGVRTP